MASYTGFSYPLRIGGRGGWEKSTADERQTQKVQESIKYLLLTRLGDRVIEPIGSSLLNSVFENMDVTLLSVLKFKVESALAGDRRFKVTNVNIGHDPTTATVSIQVDFKMVPSNTPGSVIVPIKTTA